jgi:hypothetical protein
MPVNARRLIRKMRGGAQAHLLEADDGRFYVVKFRNNPQHRRILVNEVVASRLLDHLQITAPSTAVVNLSAEFLRENPEIGIQLGSNKIPAEPGWHFGSCYPGDPDRVAVYDFVPDALLEKVANCREYLGMLAFDKWLSNADARQCIFLRAKLREYSPAYADHPLRVGFVALMVDHGYMFEGPHWRYTDSPIQGLYFRTSVYRGVTGWNDFQPWLDQMVHFPEEVIDDALKSVPQQWLNGDADELDKLLERLMQRRARIPDLIRDCSRGRINPFPNWR